jgi:hypothetical protein
MNRRNFPGFHGGGCALPRSLEGWVFETYTPFNLAMLAKQVWLLITNLGSLCAQVLRVEYYPDGYILKAGPKKESSYTWQRIVAGLKIFKRDTSGEWVMEHKLIFGKIIIGSQKMLRRKYILEGAK